LVVSIRRSGATTDVVNQQGCKDMSVIINTNTAGSIAASNLSASNAMLQKSLNRLSSGSKIVNASDDAGGVAVAARLSAAAKRTGVVSANIGNALSFLQQQDSALKTVGKIMERMSELQALFADGTKSSNDTALYDTEFTALKDSLTAMVDDEVNTKLIFATAAMSVSVNETLTTSDAVSFGEADLGATSAGSVNISGMAIETATSVSGAIQAVAEMRANNGASQSNLGFQLELQSAAKINQESAISRIMDVDIAEESTRLARYNTLVQAGTSMVAQANGSAQSALQLLR
jgi:flagellin